MTNSPGSLKNEDRNRMSRFTTTLKEWEMMVKILMPIHQYGSIINIKEENGSDTGSYFGLISFSYFLFHHKELIFSVNPPASISIIFNKVVSDEHFL